MREFFANRVMRRMITFLLLTEFLWGLGNFFVWPTTTLPAYLIELGASRLIIGALAVAIGSLMLIPQLFGRAVINRVRHRKRGIIFLHACFIAPYFLIPMLHRLLVPDRAALHIALTLGLLALGSICMGFVLPIWLDMLAQVVPLSLRGRYFGIGTLCFAGGGVLGGLGLSWLQATFGPAAYLGAFLVAGIFFCLSMVSFALAPVPVSAFEHPPEPSLWHRVRTSLHACHPRTDFGRLVMSFGVLTLAMAVVPFMIAYAIDGKQGLGFQDRVVGWLTICQALGSAGGGVVLGSLIDRIGPRLPWVAATAVVPLALLLLPFGGSLPVLMAAFVLAGVLNTHWSVTGPAMLELSPPGDKSGYVAVANMVGFLPSTLGALLLGRSIDVWGYTPAFIIAAAAGVLALLIGFTIRNRSAISGETFAPKIAGRA